MNQAAGAPGANGPAGGRLRAAARRWERLGLRQQALVLVAAGALVFGIVDAVRLAPDAAERSRLQARIDTLERDQARRTAEAARERAEQQALRVREAELRAALHDVDRALAQARAQRVGPAALRERVRALSTHDGLRLVSITTQPATAVTLPGGVAGGEPALYRHGLVVVVEGPYPQLQAYLQALEDSTLGLRWSLVSLDGRAWPAVRLELRLFVLGDQPVWRGS